MPTRRLTYLEFLDESPMTRALWLLLIGVAMAQVLDGLDFQSTTYALPVLIQDLHISPAQAGVIPAATSVGLLVGALVCSFLSDRFGRKGIFQAILASYAFGSLLSAVAPSYEWLLLARIIAGFGIGAELPVAFALLAEYAPARHRHLFIPMGPFMYSLGFLVAALLSIWLIPTFGWRSIYWVGVTPALVILYVRQFVPESVRFLLMRGRVEEAGRIVRGMAVQAGLPDVELVLPPPTRSVAPSGTARLKSALPALVALALLYFCFYIQAIGFQGWLPTIFVRQGFTLVSSISFALVIGVGGTLSMVFGGWLQERVPRKYALLLMAASGAAFFISGGLLFEVGGPVEVIVAALFLTNFCVTGINAVLYTLSSELFPTEVRSAGIGLVTAIGRTGAILGPFILGIFLTFGTAVSQIIYFFSIPLLLASLVSIVLLRVDSRQKTLEMIQAATRLNRAPAEPRPAKATI